jgi:general secretion pathway protein H
MEGKSRIGRPGRSSGVTLIELIIVLVIITIAVGISGVFYANSLPSARLGAAGREISAAIRQARLLARTHGETTAVTINLDTRRYAITGHTSRAIPAGINVRVLDEIAGEVTRGEVSIIFHDSGAVEGGTIILSVNKRQLIVKVDPIVGAIILKDSSGKS